MIAGDGQVTLGDTVIKQNARKIRRVYNDRVLVGFAGATADAFALFARLEAKLEQFQGNLNRAAVELAQEWRTDRALRHLEAFCSLRTASRFICCPGPETSSNRTTVCSRLDREASLHSRRRAL